MSPLRKCLFGLRNDCKCFLGGGNRLFDRNVVVSARNEAGFVKRRSQVNATVEHFMEEEVETLAVGLHHVGKTRRQLRQEVQAEHAADALSRERNTFDISRGLQTGNQLRRLSGESIVETFFLD